MSPIHLLEPQIEHRFWVNQPRDVDVQCSFVEAVWRFVTVNPTGRRDVEAMVENIASPIIERWPESTGFTFRFEFDWCSPNAA